SRLKGLWQRSRTIAVGNALGVVGFMALLYCFRLQNFSRLVMLLLYGLSTGFLVFKRMLKRWYDRAQNRKGLGFRHVLLVGGGKMAAQYLLALEHNPYYSFRVDGYLAARANPGLDARYLGGYDKLEVTLDDPTIDEVVVALDADETRLLTRVFAACDKHGTRITMVPYYNDYLPARPTIDVLGDCKLINVRQTPFDNILNAFIKRLMDVVGSLVLIVLTSPIMLALAIGVKLSSPGPVIFKQERVGLNKRPFMMYKFRSMRVNTEENSAWSTNSDPRKTRFGSLIRKFSLDELPQFFNVLKGDMSLVGPRPEIPYHVEHFKEEIPRYLVRQQVRPGLTGWAQINGLRGDTDIAERIRYDIWYIENWTVALDIKILFRTVFGGKMVNDEKLE
ncbi:MAG: undecaprenyl-phosphate glucose phosphotransferase, partial [Gemmiger sp.]|uniref:undecaprenyl-phosphate glucose phosphotransferase n=2 Tax=Gemmiger sp. TaxID=2049027 RepID=UPI002A91D478